MNSADPLAVLGLSGNPFAEDALPEFYFVGGQRRFLLQQAAHGLYIARSIVLVSGERGAGKSHLLAALRGELAGLADCCPLVASVLMDGAAIRREVAELYRLPAESAVDDETLVAALAQRVPVDAEPLPVALLIDDAHELSVQTLAELQRFVAAASGRVRLLLAGESTLVTAWQQLPVAAAELLELQPLDLQESADYLQTRLQAAGWRDALPLTAEQLQQLYRASGGRIGKLNELAPAALAAAGDSGAKGTTIVTRRLPWRWAAIAAAAVVVVGVALSLIDSPPDPGADGTIVGHDRTTVVLPLPASPESQHPAAVREAPPERRRVAVPAPLPDSATPPVADVAVSKSPASAPATAGPAPARIVQAPKAASAPAKPAAPPAAAAEKPKASTSAETVVRAPAASPSPAAKPYRFDEQRLLALAPEQFVLQLVGAGSDEALRKFQREHGSVKALAFEARRAGKPWFVLVAGPYANRVAAQAAVASLPSSLRASKPWPRTVASVQSDIRALYSDR